MFRKKKATAEITTALLCRSNISKGTFDTVAEYLEDSEIENVINSCMKVLSERKGYEKILAHIISNEKSFDDIAVNISNEKLQEILSTCGCVIIKRKKGGAKK